jgi:hypothetical protein
LQKIGVKYLTRYKIQNYPLGDGKFEKQFNWLGKSNNLGQIYLTRNASFEPSSDDSDWVDSCMAEIENAFLWRKPAVISTHRVNYVSNIDADNAASGLVNLDKLLLRIIKSYPDIEFVTSAELGNLIRESKNEN